MSFEKETLGFWERLIKFKDKYGYWNLTKLVLFVAFAIAVLLLAKNFGENYSFEKQKEAMTEVIEQNNQQMFIEHNEQMQIRCNIKPLVTELLKNTINEMNADRAFVFELHNGSNNTAGLPFIHCTMTYEETARNIEPIDEDYQNLSLTRFSFPEYLHKHDLWFGTVEEFADIDKKLASRMQNNGATYLVITTIRSENREIGYFGFTYCNNKEHKHDKDMMEFIVHTVQNLSKLLDKNTEK